MEGVWGVPQPLCRAITSKDTTEAKFCPSSLGLCHPRGWESGTTMSLCSLQQSASLGGSLQQILNPLGAQPSCSGKTLSPRLPPALAGTRGQQ